MRAWQLVFRAGVLQHHEIGDVPALEHVADGVIAANGGHRYRLPAAEVDVVDTTAAGDAFVGALAAALDRGDDLADALADGTAAGSYACTIEGAQASIAPRSRWQAMARELRASAAVESRR